MTKKIPYGKHQLENSDIEAMVEVLKSSSITQGEIVEDFGQAVADYSGAKYGIAVSNGTAALHLAMAALDVGLGDEVITTPMTFCATANAVLYQRGEVKFVDIDQNTLNIDPNLLEKDINEKTKLIIPVDFRGHPAALPEIKEIADDNNINVVEDGSHSIGSDYMHNGVRYKCGNGAYVDFCTFSFHPVKHITTGEGGVILTNSPELYRKVFLLRKHGIDRREEMFSEKMRVGSWKYDMESLGFNYRMTNFQAALGLSQLKRIEQYKTRRREIVNYYNERLADINEFILPYESENVNSNFHIYTLRVNENPRFDRYDFFNFLLSEDYLPMVHYIPVHLLSYYKNRYGHKKGDFPIAERYYDQTISIPLYPSLSDSEVEKVVEDIYKFVK
ncbi:UDP-4-amino-4,6-dideoxy-N-acetyl-beta-L-altrosamine transaminase [Candidatus Marinimicrobia bacterium]|nr:UDP-4-amino-4,6-dideoxy-N-acetyl-beta-L-altrosamine transaminase [Candidatus Neomarinimicrobiota bacterium]